MKILLTGGSGLVGKTICDSFEESSYQLISPSSDELNYLTLIRLIYL